MLCLKQWSCQCALHLPNMYVQLLIQTSEMKMWKTLPCRTWLMECNTLPILFMFLFMMWQRQSNFIYGQSFICGHEYIFRKIWVKETKTCLAVKVKVHVWTITMSWWAESYSLWLLLCLSWLYWICLWKQFYLAGISRDFAEVVCAERKEAVQQPYEVYKSSRVRLVGWECRLI